MDEMNYCTKRGHKLELKFLEGEGEIPFCEECHEFRFPTFSSAVSLIIYNEKRDKMLLAYKAGYNHVAYIAGYLKKGESAEEAVIRELKEETGLDALSLHINGTAYFARSNTLMISFTVIVKEEKIVVDKELEDAKFYPLEEAVSLMAKDSLVYQFYTKYHL